ncbi:hypothetical protein L596_003851 [Steinernema carpocapsae]|nr:hypothetical protein L596_003851 [Steinernema carpocapsae]
MPSESPTNEKTSEEPQRPVEEKKAQPEPAETLKPTENHVPQLNPTSIPLDKDSSTEVAKSGRQTSTSQNLYDWLSDRNEWNIRQGEDILFRPRIYQ